MVDGASGDDNIQIKELNGDNQRCCRRVWDFIKEIVKFVVMMLVPMNMIEVMIMMHWVMTKDHVP